MVGVVGRDRGERDEARARLLGDGQVAGDRDRAGRRRRRGRSPRTSGRVPELKVPDEAGADPGVEEAGRGERDVRGAGRVGHEVAGDVEDEVGRGRRPGLARVGGRQGAAWPRGRRSPRWPGCRRAGS